jgi:hypothetical protein
MKNLETLMEMDNTKQSLEFMAIAMLQNTLLPKILKELEKLNERVGSVNIESELRTGVQVQKYLNISKATLHGLVKNEKMIKGVHYHTDNGHVEYITDEIVEFKKTYIKNARSQHGSTVALNSFFDKFAA